MKKKWFTLIETVIVLAIISFLLGVTMYFWSKNIQKLNVLTFKQQFIEKYQTLYMNSISSSYIAGKKYEKIDIHMWSGFYYSIDEEKNKLLDLSDFHYSWIRLDWNPVGNIMIRLSPYKIKCNLYSDKDWESTEWKQIKFILSHKNNYKAWCFRISNYNCKLTEYICN